MVCRDNIESRGWLAFSVGILKEFPTHFFALIGALILLLLPVSARGTGSDVVLLNNGPQVISVRYVTPPVTWAEIGMENQVYRTPRLKGAGTGWQEGAPQLPVRVVWLVIPPGSTPVLGSVMPYGIQVSENKPAPVPSSVPGGDGFVASEYNEDPAYYSAVTPLPPVWVEMHGPESFRDLEVVRLAIYPFRYPTANGALLGLDSLDVSVTLQGGKASRTGSARPVEDELYQRLIANWSGPAVYWKKPRSFQIAAGSSWPGGDLYKIAVDESGIYKLTYSDLVSAGIDPSDIISQKIRIFNNGGRTLPESISSPREQAPIETAILVHGGGDETFDPGDEIWFYGRSVLEWEWDVVSDRYRHYQNPYTDHNIYWLNFDPAGPDGKRMATLGQSGTAGLNSPNSRAYYFEERELYAIYNFYDLPLYMPNLFGDIFSGSSASRTFSIYLEAVESTAPAHLTLDFQHGSGSTTHQFEILINSVPILITSTSTINVTIPAGILESGGNTLYIKHNSSGTAYLDYFEIEYTRELNTSSGELAFISPDADGLAQYQIGGLSDPWIFDVTDFDEVKYTHSSSFKDSARVYSPRRYLAVDESALHSPVSITEDRFGAADYTSLRETSLGADILVISADAFYDAMEDYEEYREAGFQQPSYEVLRVRVSDIFDEFGWGLTDPVAIRDFLNYTLDPDSGWSTPPLYILYVGDGDFDYKNKLFAGDDNWMIPYESGLTCTDDFYTCFVPGGGPASFPCLATGRWPVRSAAEVEEMIERLISYEDGSSFGPWRDRVTFVSDDEYINQTYFKIEQNHVIQTEYITETYIPDIINVQKIYLTEYPGAPDPAGGGIRKPGATDDLIDAINEGCLLVNYIGHGNPTVWAHENVFQQSRDMPLLNNGDKLPLFLAFTCDWAYWDDPAAQSMPEEMLHMPGGGAIAAIAATRLTSTVPNATLAYNFFDELFSEPTGIRLGDALMLAKTSYVTNSEKYHLLGDPVMKLVMPQLVVYIDSSSTDTLAALEQVTVSGDIRTQSGTFLPAFDGIANVQVYDSEVPITYTFDGDTATTTYILPGNLIFRGDVSVQSGQFESTFIVPIDISYGGSGGRFSVYGYSNESDGAGVNSDVVFAESIEALEDTIPPSVSLYFDSPGFRSGDPIGIEATLYVDVSDSNGVNLTGSAGHGIIVTIDGEFPIDLTDSFSYELDSYTSGTAEYTFSVGEINPGLHTAEAIAWDAANNPNTAQVSFEVTGWDELRITDVLNYPNPFNNYTRFTFVLAGAEAEGSDITIKIYTVAGRLVKVIDGIVGSDSFNYSEPNLLWNGRDHSGTQVSNGVYLYKVLVEGNPSRRLVEETGKLIVMR